MKEEGGEADGLGSFLGEEGKASRRNSPPPPPPMGLPPPAYTSSGEADGEWDVSWDGEESSAVSGPSRSIERDGKEKAEER